MRFLILMLLAATAHADFIKIANDGSQLSESAKLGSGAKDWACTYDSGTGLLWEVKLGGYPASFRSYYVEVAWFDSTIIYAKDTPGMIVNSNPQGVKHPRGGCNGLSIAEGCNTEAYLVTLNNAKVCGKSDWRLPTSLELTELVTCDRATCTDQKTRFNYLNVRDFYYWTGDKLQKDRIETVSTYTGSSNDEYAGVTKPVIAVSGIKSSSRYDFQGLYIEDLLYAGHHYQVSLSGNFQGWEVRTIRAIQSDNTEFASVAANSVKIMNVIYRNHPGLYSGTLSWDTNPLTDTLSIVDVASQM